MRRHLTEGSVLTICARRGALWAQAIGIAKNYISRSSGDIPHLYFSGAGRGMRIGNHIFH
jgi:hypothetical protein